MAHICMKSISIPQTLLASKDISQLINVEPQTGISLEISCVSGQVEGRKDCAATDKLTEDTGTLLNFYTGK